MSEKLLVVSLRRLACSYALGRVIRNVGRWCQLMSLTSGLDAVVEDNLG